MSAPRSSLDDGFGGGLDSTRRGAHRARTGALAGIVPVLAVLLVVGGVGAGAWVLFGPRGSGSGDGGTVGSSAAPSTSATGKPSGSTKPGKSPSKSATSPKPTVNRAAPLQVLNSTGTAGLAKKASTALKAKGWTVAGTGNFTPQGSLAATTVYYAVDAQKATAEAVVKDLGVGAVAKNATVAKTQITVVLASDYTP